MPESAIRILLVEDEENHAELARRAFESYPSKFSLDIVDSLQNARARLEKYIPDLFILDWLLPDGKGLELLPFIGESRPVVVMTSHGDEKLAVEALKAGAQDYVVKSGETLTDLPHIAERAFREWNGAIKLKKTQEALISSQRKLDSIVRQVPDIIYRLDPSGNISFISHAVTKYGYKVEELIGKSIFTLIHPEDRYRAKYRINERRSGDRRTKSLEISLLTKQNEKVPVELHTIGIERESHAFSIEAEGVYDSDKPSKDNFTGTQGIARDITDRIKLEEQLQQSQKMEAIGMLAGGVAHDFNNLLTTILGYSFIVLNELAQESALWKNVKEIQKAGERAASLTRQLLAFSRKQVLQPRIIDLNELIFNMDKMLRRLIGENIEFITSPQSSGIVKADPGKIEQIVMNLVVNARDAMPDGGKLTIETTDVFLDDAYPRPHIDFIPGHYILLAVCDTGCGIDKAILPHIFDPFFTTKESGKGTGLGLSTVYGIVKQSNGQIYVYSEKNIGTTFKVYLPRVDDKTPLLQEELVIDESLRGSETILLVEDEDTVRNLTATILKESGYTVLEARYGDEACQISDRYDRPIHVLITDVVLPQMSGGEIANHLTGSRPNLKIIYMSGYTDTTVNHYSQLGFIENFIQKPFTPDVLLQKVRAVLDANES